MTPPPPIALDEAQARLLASAAPLPSETLPVEQALGRYLAAPVSARRSQPAADLSAMDGYAMRVEDQSGPWHIVGESAAGHPFPQTLRTGEAARISTGALMPEGAGAVLLQEEALREGELLRAAGGEPSPRHVRRAGFDFRAGETLLHLGTPLTPGRVALVLASGNAQVEVGRTPSLTVLDSGDELAADPTHCLPHQIPASNGAMLAAMAAPFTSQVTRLGPVPDTMESLLAALEQAEGHDVLVTSGGASVGDHDLVRPALERWGANIEFWRVSLKPGKPLLVARRGRQLILGLPGNPVSSFITATLFLLPLLRRLGGSGQPLPVSVSLPLLEPLPPTGDRLEFLRARLAPGGVVALGQQDSSALCSLSVADALIRRAARSPAAPTGEPVNVILLEQNGNA